MTVANARGDCPNCETLRRERDAAVKTLDDAISGANDLLDNLLRAEKARAVKVTASAISKAQATTVRAGRDEMHYMDCGIAGGLPHPSN